MTVYYRDETVTVCSTTLKVTEDEYELRQLGYVWHHSRRSGGGHLRTKLLLGAILVLLAVAAAAILFVEIDFGRYQWHALSGTIVVGIGLIAAAGFGVDPLLDLLDQGHDHSGGTHEIWARVNGRDVLLFSTTDSLRFGKIYRALRRAVERQHS